MSLLSWLFGKKEDSDEQSEGNEEPTAMSPLVNDLIGVGIMVAAVAMAVALLVPSDAVLTHAIAEGLRLGFGEGALLAPIALAIFGGTIFLPTDRTLFGRVALGLAFVVLAVLSALSILAPGAASSPDVVLEASVAVASGGYVGSGVAWVLLTFVGQVVGMVILVGLAIVGTVICGFSVSDAALRLQGGVLSAAERLGEAREKAAEKAAQRKEERRKAKEDAEKAAADAAEATAAAPASADDTVVDPNRTRTGLTVRLNKLKTMLLPKLGKQKDASGVEGLLDRKDKSGGLDHAPAAMTTEGLRPVDGMLADMPVRTGGSDDEEEATAGQESGFAGLVAKARGFVQGLIAKVKGAAEGEAEAEAQETSGIDAVVSNLPEPQAQPEADLEPTMVYGSFSKPQPEPEASRTEVMSTPFSDASPTAYVGGAAGTAANSAVAAAIAARHEEDGYGDGYDDDDAYDDDEYDETGYEGDDVDGSFADDADDETEYYRPSVPGFLEPVTPSRPVPTCSSVSPSPVTSRPQHAKPVSQAPQLSAYELPPLTLLDSNPNSASSASSDVELEATSQRLQSTLEEFGLRAKVAGWTAGPLVTTFKIEMGEGERVTKITNLQDDIQLSLASESVRIFAPIPGTSFVGIEIPNKRRQNVCLGDVLPDATGGPLEFAIGRDSEGTPVIADLARMPHMLVAGTTGSGKSVLINAIIMSLVMRTTPEQVRLILVDPKRVEFSCYAGLPHLYVPVVTEPRQAASALQWAVTEMDRRLKVFERASARDITVYNRMVREGKFADMENPPSEMPYLVIVIDELSDLMMVAGKDVESSIVRIAQLARAAGIHLVLATQRPSADVVTGLIKSNVDTRVALKVSSSIDSRVILDQIGAERLMGRGDMLFRRAGGVLRRVLGAYASDEEIESVVTFIRDQREPDYHDEILSAVTALQPGATTLDDLEENDPLVWEAAQMVVDSQMGSTSGLQRRLKVGYARAGRIMDNLERLGVVGPPDGSKPREVLLDAEGLEELRAAEEAYREV